MVLATYIATTTTSPLVLLDLGRACATCSFLSYLTTFRVKSDSKAIVVVVSPLIALIRWLRVLQWQAAFIDHESDMGEKASVCEGAYQLVLFSPEGLISNRRRRHMLWKQPYAVRLVGLVIDEAHCVKKW